MNKCEAKAYADLRYMCENSYTISGLMFGCSKINLKYNKVISKYRFLNILKELEENNCDEKNGGLEHFIRLFLDEKGFISFIKLNKKSIMNYPVKIKKGKERKGEERFEIWE